MDSSVTLALGPQWNVEPLSTSSFAQTWRARHGTQVLFVKSAPEAEADLLESEADGLAALAATATVRVPEVVVSTRSDGHAVLALEWLDLRRGGGAFGRDFGHALGRLHATPPPEGDGRFGWRRDNRLGATVQVNPWSDGSGVGGWIDFLSRARLGAMRDLLTARGAPSTLAATVDGVIETLPSLFTDGYVPRACLVHGDLWSGNWGALADGTPVVFDPAVSCSDAEAELAMMELFGGPPDGFFEAYAELVPSHPGYRRRRDVYQLYHLLNHALLFGGGYVGESLRLAEAIRPGD